jgi:hypothetical protein
METSLTTQRRLELSKVIELLGLECCDEVIQLMPRVNSQVQLVSNVKDDYNASVKPVLAEIKRLHQVERHLSTQALIQGVGRRSL